MDSAENTCDQKRELDDSGCVHDDSIQQNIGQTNLLDFSDDVLLCIFRHCPAPDLKALAHSCLRLGRLVRERSLWRNVDASQVPCSRARLRWYLDNVLHSDTRSLKLNGYAKDAKGCVGLINIQRKESLEPKKNCFHAVDGFTNEITFCGGFQEFPTELIEREPPQGNRQNARYFISAQRPQLPRHRCCMSWPDDNMGRPGPNACSGPQFSISPELFRQLSARCLHLTTLCLDYCNIDCHSTGLAVFPKSLKKLSLRGSKCYNVTFDKSFVYKIQDHLPLLVSLDVSECEWMEPAGLLPLSKMTALEELVMQDCYKLSEFVAYASLTARYGFKTLKSLDLRGSPVGDSEVSALGWLPKLEKLWLSARGVQRARPHAHYADDERSEHLQLDPWEVSGLEYTSISNPDTSAENIGSEDGSLDESSTENKMDNDANNDENKKGTKRKSTDNSDGKGNGEPSRKRRKDSKKDDKQNKGYKAIGVISINGLRRALRFDNQQNRNEERRGDAGVANQAIPEVDAIRVNGSNNEIRINMGPSENGNGKVSADNENVVNEEEPKNNGEDADKAKENDKNDENDPSNSQLRPDELPLLHPSAECVIDCIKIDQMHDAKAKRGRSNEVILIASSSRKHRLPRNFPDYDRVHINRNPDPVMVAIRPQRMHNGQNGNENRPGPSNEGAANAEGNEQLGPYIRFTGGPNNNVENKILMEDLLLPPEELQLKMQQMQQQGQIQLPEPVKMEEQKPKQEHDQKSEQVLVEVKEQRSEQTQTVEQVNLNQMDTSEQVESQEQVLNPDQKQKLEVQRPKQGREQEPMQIDKQEQRLEPMHIEEQEQKPEQMEELEQKPEQIEELEHKPEHMEELEQKPEQIEELEHKPEHMEELEQKPEQMEELDQKPEQMEEQKQKLEKIEEQEQKPEKLDGQKLEKRERKILKAKKRQEQKLKKIEEQKLKPEKMEKQTQTPEKIEEQQQKPENIEEQKQKPENIEEQKQNPEQEQNPENIEEQNQNPEQEQNPENIEEQNQNPEQEQNPENIEEQNQNPEREQNPENIEEQKQRPEPMQVLNILHGLEQGQRLEQGIGPAPRPVPIQYQIEPRHHVLYVGVGPQLNTYRFPRDASELIRHVNYGPMHLDSRSLVTDFALRRFGRAEGDVNIIHFDPNCPIPVGQSSGSRPDRSNLRLLSVNGYRNVTDRSLVHLATAAPHLEYVDFTGTNISANGVEVFKGMNPDCTFVHSPFDEME